MRIFGQDKLILLIFAVSLFFTYSYIDFEANMSVGSGHAYLAKSLALSHNFDLNEYWGNAGVDVIKIGDNYYSSYAPFNAVLLAIPYFALQVTYFFWTHLFGEINGDISLILESLAFSLPSSLALAGILIFLKKHIANNTKISPFNLNLLILGTGLGTLLFSYSVSYFNHVISAFFIFFAFYILSGNRDKKYLLAGILTGLAFLTEFPTILFCFAVLCSQIFLFVSKKKSFKKVVSDLFGFALPVAVSILAILIYNKYLFGNPFLFAETILRGQKALIEAETHSFSQNPFYGFYGELFSPLKGLFVYSPFLIFGIFGIKTFFKRHSYNAILSLVYIVLILIIYSLWNDCFGASVYGSRYLITAIPFLVISAAYFLEKTSKAAPIRYLLVFLVSISILVTLSNAWIGIARGKFAECEKYLNSMNPYTSAFSSLANKDGLKTSPIIFKQIWNRNSDSNPD